MIRGATPPCCALVASLCLSACASSTSSGARAGSATSVAAVADGSASEAQQAEAKYVAVSTRLGQLPPGAAVDPQWLTAEMQAVVDLDPGHAAARFNLAVLTEHRGDHAAARRLYQSIHESQEDFIPAAENLAAFMAESDEIAAARALYERVIAKDPANVTGRLGLARLELRAGRYKQAIGLCRKALQRKADALEAFRIMAVAYRQQKNQPMAELVAGRGLRVAKNDPALHYTLAQILLARGDVVNGVAGLKKVVGLRPSWLQARADLGTLALKYRDFGTAAQQFEAIVKEAGGNDAARVSLAVAYKGLGRFSEAEAIYKKILAQQQENLDVLWNLAVLYHHHLNRYAEAVKSYKLYEKLAGSGDKRKGRVAALVRGINKAKNDRAKQEARAQREERRKQAVDAVCSAVAKGRPARKAAKAIGNDEERIEVAWQLFLQGEQSIGGGDLVPGEASMACAFAVLPQSPLAKTSACAPMKVKFTRLLYNLGRLEDAARVIKEALVCDAANPDAVLIKQQLSELRAAAAQPSP